RWIGALAALLVVAGLGVAAWLWRGVPEPLPATGGAPLPPAEEGSVREALTLAREDSAAIKSRWISEVSGLDLSALTPPRREIFLRFANAERCTCGCGYTLAGCRASDMSCDVSGRRLA